MKPEFLSRTRGDAHAGVRLFEGVDISGIYDDDDEVGVSPRTVAAPAIVLSPGVAAVRQARRDIRLIEAQRSQRAEKLWIYSALFASFAMVVGIALT
jgi:hypothetical protein